jgi:hypothetical protein
LPGGITDRFFPLIVYYPRSRFSLDTAMMIWPGHDSWATLSDEYARWRHKSNRMVCVLPQTAANCERQIATLAFPNRTILLQRILRR